MELKELTTEQLKTLYDEEMKRAFPPYELKPLSAMEALHARGRYDTLALFDGVELLGYAMMWLEPGCPFALLDYLGTVEGKRNRGLGSVLLDLLSEYYKDYRGIFGEAEAPENGAPEGEPLRRRRLEFYHRNGFRYGGYDCALFGVHYQVLIRGRDDVSPHELIQVHHDIYQNHMPRRIFQRYVQIPLGPGEKPNPAGEWLEEEP